MVNITKCKLIRHTDIVQVKLFALTGDKYLDKRQLNAEPCYESLSFFSFFYVIVIINVFLCHCFLCCVTECPNEEKEGRQLFFLKKKKESGEQEQKADAGDKDATERKEDMVEGQKDILEEEGGTEEEEEQNREAEGSIRQTETPFACPVGPDGMPIVSNIVRILYFG